MDDLPRHDYHHCGCTNCARIREKIEREKITDPNKYRERKDGEKNAVTVMVGIFIIIVAVALFWVFSP